MKLRSFAAGSIGSLSFGAIGLLACGDGFNDALAGSSGNAPGDGGQSFGDAAPSTDRDAGAIGAASGIVIVHAAAFHSFRLCFENFPLIAPQPDDTVMPEANIVGVEVGSAVRIGPLDRAPGKVYVFDRRKLRALQPGEPPKSCKRVLLESTAGLEYKVAGPIDSPLGVDHVDVLAVTGCTDQLRLNELGISSAECENWDPVNGSIGVRTLPLYPSFAATTTSLPVQLVHMSTMLEDQRSGAEIDVTYGAIDGGTAPLSQEVSAGPQLFDASAPVTLSLDQADPAVYGSHGFRVALRPPGDDGGAPTFAVDQSLADVQELSSPTTVPTTYYLAASNYALLLLGDPRVRTKLADGGPNDAFDPRRAVHLLAVPVKDPESADAGVPDIIDDAGPATGDQ